MAHPELEWRGYHPRSDVGGCQCCQTDRPVKVHVFGLGAASNGTTQLRLCDRHVAELGGYAIQPERRAR